MDIGYHGLNLLLWVFHTGLILFNLFGWMFRRTRVLNLVSILLTAGSWFVGGLFCGMGYCFLTEWHWQVREALDIYDNPDTFVELLIRTMIGYAPSPEVVRVASGGAFGAAFTCSLFVNMRDFIRSRRSDIRQGRRGV